MAANAPGKMVIRSTAFAHNAVIPKKHTGDGEDVSPPLAWSSLPAGTKELALICDDPDAPSAEPWVHWVIYKIPPKTTSLPEGVATTPTLSVPSGALQGKNSWNAIGYRGPAPPAGTVHHYHFKLYALDIVLSVEGGLSKALLLKAMRDHTLATAELIGTYKR